MKTVSLKGNSLSRRSLFRNAALLSAAGAGAVRAASEPASSKLKVSIFSKHLQFLQGAELAQTAADIGFDGIDITVRNGGHVDTARVRQDLPPLVAVIRNHGLEVPMITTDIVDADTPHTADILKAMAELGIDISGQVSKTLERYLGEPFDAVITVCDDANEACPVFPGAARRLHWSFPDPSRATGSEEEQLAVYRWVRDAIRTRIERELLAAPV